MAKFSKRHYLALSTALRNGRRQFPPQEKRALDLANCIIAQMLEKDNPAFDADKFLDSCRWNKP